MVGFEQVRPSPEVHSSVTGGDVLQNGCSLMLLPVKGNSLRPTIYLYDGMNSIEEVDNTGSVLAKYIHGAVVDEDLAMLRSGTASYYHQDGLGSITSLSSSTGALAQTYAYDSFGKTTASTGTLTSPFQYTGREFDSETGIYYYRARYFDPSAGRFLSEDSVRFGAGSNFYRYVQNNPLRWIDPSGNGRTCWSVTANGMTEVPCGGDCIQTSSGYSCSVPQPSGPPPEPLPPPIVNDCPCSPKNFDRAFEKIIEEEEAENDVWPAVAKSAGVKALEWGLELAEVEGTEWVPGLDIGLLGWDLYEAEEHHQEALEKIRRLEKMCP